MSSRPPVRPGATEVGGNRFRSESRRHINPKGCGMKGPVIESILSPWSNIIYEIRLGKDGNVYCSCPAWLYQ